MSDFGNVSCSPLRKTTRSESSRCIISNRKDKWRRKGKKHFETENSFKDVHETISANESFGMFFFFFFFWGGGVDLWVNDSNEE